MNSDVLHQLAARAAAASSTLCCPASFFLVRCLIIFPTADLPGWAFVGIIHLTARRLWFPGVVIGDDGLCFLT